MNIGDKVKINPTTIPDYFDEESNPLGSIGSVIEVHDKDEFNIHVDFGGNVVNSYNENHLVPQG